MRKRKSGLRTSSPEGPCRRVDEEADEVAEPPPNRLSRARHHSWIFTIPFEDAHRYPRLLQLEFPLHLVQEILHSSLVLDSCISIYKVLTHFGALVGYKSNTLFLMVTTALRGCLVSENFWIKSHIDCLTRCREGFSGTN